MTTPDSTQITLAAELVTLLAVPFVQGIAKQVGQDTFSQAKAAVLAAVHQRFHQDKNNEALTTLALFEKNPATFQEALTRLLNVTLVQHPEWAGEMRDMLAAPAVQQVVAHDNAAVTNVQMQINSGTGHQSVEAHHSQIDHVEMHITS